MRSMKTFQELKNLRKHLKRGLTQLKAIIEAKINPESQIPNVNADNSEEMPILLSNLEKLSDIFSESEECIKKLYNLLISDLKDGYFIQFCSMSFAILRFVVN